MLHFGLTRPRPAAEGSLDEIRVTLDRFLRSCREPALLEPGEDLFPLTPDNFTLDIRASRLTLQAWDHTRNLTRRLLAARLLAEGRLELTVERFAKKQGSAYLLDLARRSGAELGRRTHRLMFRERFRLLLRRQFPGWTLAEISADPNLEYSLSPAYPRAFLRHGQHGWAAIAAPPESDVSGALTFGLIWLAHLRARERRVAIAGLAIFVSAGDERATALRLRHLNPEAAQFTLFTYTAQDQLAAVDPQDCGNLDTRLERCTRPVAGRHLERGAHSWTAITTHPAVESIPRHDGRTSLRVRGIEFATMEGADLLWGLNRASRRQPATERHLPEIARLVDELDRARSPHPETANHPLYRQFPEAWLESQARAQIETVDPNLRTDPIYGQVPAFAGGDRGVLDLLAVDYSGRLAVVELKAAADIQLPLQALDYWLRVAWHVERGEFPAHGYFPGIELRTEPPRLLLVSPSFEFHPTTETVLEFFAPHVEVERIGLALEWRRGLEIVFRLRGAERPH